MRPEIPERTGVFVVGSINQDLVLSVEHRPEPGETVTGARLSMHPGGKGANQAVAAALLGVPTAILGRVGDDAFGEGMLSTLCSKGVDTDFVQKTDNVPTGTAFITVTPDGENAIVVASDANAHVRASDVEAASDSIGKAGVLVLQLELGLEAVCRAAEVAEFGGTLVILNLAPYTEVPSSLLRLADPLVLNEHEAGALIGARIEGVERAIDALPKILSTGARSAVVTLGRLGAVVARDGSVKHLPAPAVETVDTTAAGDAFVGGLAAELWRGNDLGGAATYAVGAGAAAVTKSGAQSSLPTREEVESVLASVPDESRT